ncbi:FkbM family methyltransferase [Paracraurococcus ruber]|nr:FkbM family methyltransferase [Paracraurococcus ruber]
MTTGIRFALGRLRSLVLGGAPGVSRRDIVAAHELLLGRLPESEAAIRQFSDLPDRAALGTSLIRSPAFRARLATEGVLDTLYHRRQTVYLGDRILAYTHAGARMFLLPDDVDLTPHLLESGQWEAHVEAAIRRLLRPGQAAADIGANVGYHSLAIAQSIGPAGRLEALEANPAVARLLRATLASNGFLDRARVHAVAALDRPGQVTLAAAQDHHGSGHVATGLPDGWADRYPVQWEVPARRLDDLLPEAARLDLIRLDIEGAEPLALRGAEGVIRRSPGLRIIAEWSVPMMAPRTDLPGFVAWLSGLGFGFWRIGDGGALDPVHPAATLELPHCDLLLSRGGVD